VATRAGIALSLFLQTALHSFGGHRFVERRNHEISRIYNEGISFRTRKEEGEDEIRGGISAWIESLRSAPIAAEVVVGSVVSGSTVTAELRAGVGQS